MAFDDLFLARWRTEGGGWKGVNWEASNSVFSLCHPTPEMSLFPPSISIKMIQRDIWLRFLQGRQHSDVIREMPDFVE